MSHQQKAPLRNSTENAAEVQATARRQVNSVKWRGAARAREFWPSLVSISVIKSDESDDSDCIFIVFNNWHLRQHT